MAVWEILATAIAITLMPTLPVWELTTLVFAPLLVLAAIKSKIQSASGDQNPARPTSWENHLPRQRASDLLPFPSRLVRHGVPLGLGWGFMMTQLFALHPTPFWSFGWADLFRALASSALFGTVTTATNYWVDRQARIKAMSRRS